MKVKLQGHWLRVEILHVYGNGMAWYCLKGNHGCGWVDKGFYKK
jgi:hypothetical protein